MPAVATRPDRQLVLVGGGHTHVQVLRRFAMEPPPETRLTVVLDRPIAVYSGMVPGFVAGQYAASELEIDVLPLARRAAARVILSPAVGIDAALQRLELADRPAIPYDLISFDIGSTVAGLELPGIREHAIPTRPINRLVDRIDSVVEAARDHRGGTFRVLVVGGGAGGVELAFTLWQRLGSLPGLERQLTLLEGGERILSGYPRALIRRVEAQAARRGIDIVCGRRVEAAEPGGLLFEGGERLPCEALIWVTGAVSHPLFADSGLPTDERGFVRVRPTLQVEGCETIFAVGDCATLSAYPETAKAGVYAVRQGPYLIDNLRAALVGRRLRRYRPQGDFLTLLNLGDGTAIGSKRGLAFSGAWVWRLKDWIDRRFMRRFQVLEEDGRLTETFARLPEMNGEGEMFCGGCAAKIGQSALKRALSRLGEPAADASVLIGLEAADDAAAYRTPCGDVVVTSIDAFRAFSDDPWLVGRVAAINAASDVQAKGVRPRYAQALVSVPQELGPEGEEEALYQVLAGARQALDGLGITLVGGHSTTAPELIVGFSIEGVAENGAPLLPLSGLDTGQSLLLTKPLGTGVVLHADMKGHTRGPWLEAALASMVTSNAEAASLARGHGATAVTDVTGFGLAGHLSEMLRQSGVAAEIDLSALPVLPGALELLELGERSTLHAENARARRGLELVDGAGGDPRLEILFDPQTSGGLLIATAAEQADSLLAALHRDGFPQAAAVGRVVASGREGPRIRVRTGSGDLGRTPPGPNRRDDPSGEAPGQQHSSPHRPLRQ